MTAVGEVPKLRLSLWRDDDETVADQPGVQLGSRPAEGNPAELAARLYREGVRRVALSEAVDLTGAMARDQLVWAMLFLRELTSWGLAIDWQLRPGSNLAIWQRLNHLYPPREILDQRDGAEALADWRQTFYLCKCIYRRGPGFIEVRDRRDGKLSRFVVDDPEYLTAIERLIDSSQSQDIPSAILAEFIEEGLAGQAGDLAWWLPYRVHRWPWPSMIV